MTRGRGAAPSLRQLRVGEELRHALVRVLDRSDFKDPMLVDTKITVTEVSVSPDLKSATAFVTPLGGEQLVETVAALNRAAGFVRGQLSREIELRHTPRLGFAADHSFLHASKVEALLARPRVKRDLESNPSDQPDEEE